MALGPTSITEAREKAIDFTVPFDYEPWDILIPESIVTVDLTAYFPFSGLVWTILVLVTVGVGVLEWGLAKVGGNRGLLYPNNPDLNQRRHPRPCYPLTNYLLDALGNILSQAVRQPHTGPVRVLSGVWLVVCVVVIASYSSKLISSLTVRVTEPPVKSLQDLVESKKLLWTYLANSAMEEVFKNSAPNTLFGKVGQLHKDRPGLLVYSFEEGVAAVKTKNFAYFEDNSWLEFAVADDLAEFGECRMTVVRDIFFSTRFGIILQDGATYKDAFTLEILQIIQSGLMDAWKKKFWPKSHCIGASSSSSHRQPLRPLNLLDLGGTMILELGGLVLGAFVFIVEVLLHRCY
ncbi:hypothetical protein Pcinc_018222 [Petrolisthes cinctipes]|uniref:Ionotropic glutamate receptor C-terminal domain-containing protein n=1 Tax=Petrolisthes cinctipes TaxID=88211 RepID=A0AAE1KMR2_PETCI|nr:hypothetical protein Pcinc_018222 [Petrolisthes cinctipes]